MESAFGVDHGEISKIETPGRKRARRRAEQDAGRKRRAAKINRGLQVPVKAVNTRVSVADVGRGAGKAVDTVGRFATRKPGLVGAGILGGGGYAAYRLTQREDLPKRKKNANA